MDKYEFNIKVEQIKKMVTKGDFKTSMKIADTIDWRRVRKVDTLSMISQVYEKNGEYQEAKEVLLLAFERAPVGKRLLYKLTELALKEGSLREAEDYCREFCDMAPDDSRQYLLRYMILKEKKASNDQLIHILEQYTNLEVEERWMYELALLYSRAGYQEKCIRLCDKIALLFGFGKYVDKAMELKARYAPLTKHQMDLVENKGKYEAKLKAVEQEYDGEPGTRQYHSQFSATDLLERLPSQWQGETADSLPPVMPQPKVTSYGQMRFEYEQEQQTYSQPDYPYEQEQQTYGQPDYPYEQEQQTYGQPDYPYEQEQQTYIQTEYPYEQEQQTYIQTEYDQKADSSYNRSGSQYGQVKTTFIPTDTEHAPQKSLQETAVSLVEDSSLPEQEEVIDEDLAASFRQADMEKKLAEEMSKISVEDYKEAEPAAERTKVPVGFGRTAAVPKPVQEQTSTIKEELPLPQTQKPASVNHLMIESRTPESGFQTAVEALKRLHQESGSHHQVAKISGSRLNQRGIPNVTEKLLGKDLIVEEAGDLSDEDLNDLYELITSDTTGMIVVLIDNPHQMEEIHHQNPELASLFECISSDDSYESAQPEETEPPIPDQENAKEALAEEISEEVPPPPVLEESDIPDVQENADEELNLDAFADYACQYASQIDCSIKGKSMLALYERIELMEEDGIPLTKANAEELIETAADKAENPSLGRLIAGVFSSKYDKNGLLILKEEHFI